MSCVEIKHKVVSEKPTFNVEKLGGVFFVVKGQNKCDFATSVVAPPSFVAYSTKDMFAALTLVCSLAKIFSCFGGGGWIDTLPWINRDIWKNDNNL